ncbi:MAG: hypothetical protein NTY68_04365 [Candidatus Micrarchaeota archaeon]|nr:hypothetical protein [Candidatus Micrarchaeota archaeon]
MSFKKGQSLSFDAIIASVIFIITLFSFLNFLFYFQNIGDYNKDMMEKEAVRVSILLFSENDTYGIMENTMTNTLIPKADINQRIENVSLTTPYSVCLKINSTWHPSRSDCTPALSQKVSMSRIVRDNDGELVPMSIFIFQK